ncbi:MAG: aspartate aminotransferase family protein [Methylacidiphilales bacterium]|nr:aspartate aminotransferase family protein [Candidatus Methylacidiphilales bacterium]
MLPQLVTPVPGPRSRQLAADLRAHESRNITYVSPGFPIFWERAHGANVLDVDGNRFLDLTSGFGVASLGYTPRPMINAVQDQVTRLYHAMGDVHPSAEKAALCQKLSQLTFESWDLGPGKTILTNSGSEAVEAALKTAWLATKKRGVLAFSGSYHGLGYGALTVTGRHLFRDPFSAQLADFATFLPFPDCHHCPFDALPCHPDNCLPDCQNTFLRRAERLLAQGSIGAILVEPIQGRGGEIVPPDWLLPILRSLADQFRILLIFDEIYTGFHRTGRRFACDHWDAQPDLICLGKALTGGFPLAACVGRAQVMDNAWPESTGEALHTSTFLGNPLGCRMALQSLELLEAEPWSERTTKLGNHLRAGLRQLQSASPKWGPIRGLGLMQGIELLDAEGRPDPALAGRLVEAMLARGVIILSGGVHQNVLSFTPPFVITESEIDFALDQLAQAFEAST